MRVSAAALLALGLAALSSANLAAQPPQANPAPNLLLVTIDTLRADRVGAYGYAKGATPALDGLASRGVLVEDAVVQVPETRPSHVSIFTGRLPYEHGVRDNLSPPLDARFPTLATLLKDRGYATGGFIGAYPVSRDSGLDRGFDRFDDPFGRGSGRAHDDRSARPAREVVDPALAWLSGLGKRPFFAWVHLFDPHSPYTPPSPYRERFKASPYDGEVAYADAQLARLLEWLARSGEAARTLVVVTSDHGEGLGDHGEDEHLVFLYDTTLRVPLVMSWPGRLPQGARVKGQFRSIDLLPTLLDLLGGPAPATTGASRAAVLRAGGTIPDNESYAEALYGELHFGWAPLRALRGEGWKYVHAPRAELYDLRADPGETRNRLDDRGQVATTMRQHLLALDNKPPPAAQAAFDPDAAEQLAALGYVGGALFVGPPSGVDPKDKIAEYQKERRDTDRGLERFFDGDYAGAVRVLKPLVAPAKLPDGRVVERWSYNVSYYLGRSLLELRRFDEAVVALQEAVRVNPRSNPAWAHLARAQAGAGHLKEALASLERGLSQAPKNPDLLQMKGRMLLREGANADARAVLEDAKRLDPKNALVWVDLSTLFRNQAELQPALSAAETAVQLAPKSPETLVARGLARGAVGREAEAGKDFEAALAVTPSYPDALYFLAAIHLRAGHADAAVPLLERLFKEAPDYPRGRELLAQAKVRTAPAPEGAVHIRLVRVRDRARAEDALRRARSGEDFAALARELSQDPTASRGGDLGLVRAADLAEPLRSAALPLTAGELSALVETADGFVLLKRER
jgi:arylsulfatase A-like enzyme/cytochrome c-type biogenesis protein CcmH/NrfG